MPTAITKGQIKKISTLLSIQKLDDDIKCSLVNQFTNGRTVSRKEMYTDEAEQLIRHLAKSDPCVKMRRKIFSICHDLGWLYKDMHELNAMIINRFLFKRGVVKKPIERLSYGELVKVITQLDTIRLRAKEAEMQQQLAEVLAELGVDLPPGTQKTGGKQAR